MGGTVIKKRVQKGIETSFNFNFIRKIIIKEISKIKDYEIF